MSERSASPSRSLSPCLPQMSPQPQEQCHPWESSKHGPSDESSLLCVRYPGYVKNIQRVLGTLGGEEKIMQSWKDGTPLELRYNFINKIPTNSLVEILTCSSSTPIQKPSKPVQSEPKNSYGILLKIRRPKKKAKIDNELSYEIVGLTDTIIPFKGLADFQYMSHLQKDGKPHIYSRSGPNHDILHPHFFSADVPIDLAPKVFCKEPANLDFAFKENPGKEVMIEKAEKQRGDGDQYISFSDPSPLQPPNSLLNEHTTKADLEILESIKLLFEKQPVWSRAGILANLPHIKKFSIKRLLNRVAYSFSNGPFRTLCVKYGYDPRTDPESRMYQILDFRLSPILESASNRARGISPTPRSKSPVMGAAEDDDIQEYRYRTGEAPKQRQALYQLCDLDDTRIQNFLERSKVITPCDRLNGFFSPDVLPRIRTIMVRQIKERLGFAVERTLSMEESAPEPEPNVAEILTLDNDDAFQMFGKGGFFDEEDVGDD